VDKAYIDTKMLIDKSKTTIKRKHQEMELIGKEKQKLIDLIATQKKKNRELE